MALNKDKIKKVVLAYSGGLDTSVIIPWLKENYNNCEVIAVAGNVGQKDELEGLEAKALATGASKLYIEDLTEEFVNDFVVPGGARRARSTRTTCWAPRCARPIIAKRLAEIALKEGADAICHGCTGKGNDQVRFELSIKAFAPDMPIIAPWREWYDQVPRGGNRLRRGASHSAEDQPRDQLLQGQEPLAPVPRGSGSGGSGERAASTTSRASWRWAFRPSWRPTSPPI